MKSNKLGILFMLLIAGLFLQSCAKDEALTDNIDTVIQTNNNDNGNDNGNGNNTSNNSDVSSLNNEILSDWTDLMLELERYAGGMRPNASARALAYIYLSAYETAVPGMHDFRSNENNLDGLRINEDELGRNVDWELALNACFATAIDHFLLNLPALHNNKISTFENTKEAQLSAGLSQDQIDDSKQWGNYVAQQIIAYSQTDNEAEEQVLEPQPRSYEPPTGDGFWTYSADEERALFPYWESVRTFVVSPNQTTTVAPIAYSENIDSPYFAQMQAAYTANDEAREEDGEQLWIAEFWSDDVDNVMFSPPARQFSIANQLIDQMGTDLAEALTLYVKLGFAVNDAAVSTWKYKYEHMVMRPNVYIHEFIDPGFQTNLFRLIYWPNPSFPGYPSGHSCFASAAGGIFIDFFGDNTTFTDRSHEGREEFRGTPRTFASFSDMAEENAFSRVPFGVHISMDCAEGLRLGYEISDAVNEFQLKRDPS